ncbi:caspase family protein [uncultured Prevotella sp.]|uniref:caspase family protein n=1 Tax=uncultured Prevotella sp. TaxID=159272 RepID=UPI0026074F5D|nr:caspase family protein [uncultured Prevotella sp.]
MKTRFFTYFLLLLSLSVTAQTKRALVIGLGEQQDKAWNKINGDKDVPYVQAMLKNAGFKSVTTLVNRQATKVGIVRAFKRMTASCKHGDVVYIHYSGHGQQMTDVHNDERDGLDECWIPYDACRKASATYHGEKHLTDDELNVYLNAIRDKIGAKGKLLVVIDACHSGDGTRGDEDEVVRGVEEVFEAVKSLIIGDNDKEKVINQKAKPLAERWITLSACKSDQVNIEMKNPAVGKLTYALWMELKNGDKINNEEFIKRIRKFVNRNTSSRPQQPVLTGNDKDNYNIIDILRK